MFKIGSERPILKCSLIPTFIKGNNLENGSVRFEMLFAVSSSGMNLSQSTANLRFQFLVSVVKNVKMQVLVKKKTKLGYLPEQVLGIFPSYKDAFFWHYLVKYEQMFNLQSSFAFLL